MIVVDTGPLVTMASEQDRYHVRCVEWWRGRYADAVGGRLRMVIDFGDELIAV